MRSRKKEGALKPNRKLDKKSSRGVMFENEGLRLRTIEINAEVEQGQSDLRKLKKENETLKQQVWTLRDEYDKLENLVKHGVEEEDDESENDENNVDTRKIRSPIEEHDSEEEEEEAMASSSETDNLSDLKNACSSDIQSFDLTLNKEEEFESDDHYPHVSYMCQGAIPVAGPSQRQGREEPQLLISPSVEMTVHPLSDTKSQSSEPYVTQRDHFNLDQLLDFASSFHYDRRKHMTEDEPAKIALPTLSKEERCQEAVSSNVDEEKRPSPLGFSAIRRRSSTVFEKLKRANSSAFVKEVKQVSLCKDGVNAVNACAITTSESPESNTLMYTRSSYYFAGSLDGRCQSLGTGLNTAVRTPVTPAAPLYSSSSSSNIASGTTSSLDAGLPLVSIFSHRNPSSVRLSSIEPNTLMLSVIEIPQLWDITTQEIIDELEGQISFLMHDIRGIRVTSHAAYISMGHRDTLLRLLECGLTVRGYLCPLIDITLESIIVVLTGVPHYIADATLTILLSAFGIVIGEIERRYYKGVDTGERFVRIKLKNHIKLPKYVTVGGCRIVLTVHGSELPVSKFHDSALTTTPFPSGLEVENTPKPFSEKGWNFDPVSEDGKYEIKKGARDNVSKRSSLDGSLKKNSEKGSFCKNSKTFASRCLVNLKKPDRPSSTSSGKSSQPGTPPPPPARAVPIGANTSIYSHKKEEISRTGSGERTPRSSLKLEPVPQLPKPGHHSPIISRRGIQPQKSSHHSPILSKRGLLPQDSRQKDTPKSTPTMVMFDEKPKNLYTVPHVTSVPVISTCAPILANGILRKSSLSTLEQQSSIPTQTHGATATIRNRLKMGRSVSYDSGREKYGAKERKKCNQVSKMESIRENTQTDSSCDVNPSRASRSTCRRDSEKSSNSNNSKNGNNKPKKEVIDLPWCGCWGNGCF